MTTPRQIAARMTEEAIRGRKRTLRESIAALLPEAHREAAFVALSVIPPELSHLRRREAHLYTNPVAPIEPLPINWTDTVNALGELRPDYKRNPARLITRLRSSQSPLETLAHRRGKPPYPYRDLILFDVARIEHFTDEQEFTFTRNPDSGEVGGKKVDVLMAALDCQLFASGAPPVETVIGIIKVMHE